MLIQIKQIKQITTENCFLLSEIFLFSLYQIMTQNVVRSLSSSFQCWNFRDLVIEKTKNYRISWLLWFYIYKKVPFRKINELLLAHLDVIMAIFTKDRHGYDATKFSNFLHYSTSLSDIHNVTNHLTLSFIKFFTSK